MYSDFCFIFLIQHSLNKTGLISVSIVFADNYLYQIARLGAGPSRLLQVNRTLIIKLFSLRFRWLFYTRCGSQLYTMFILRVGSIYVLKKNAESKPRDFFEGLFARKEIIRIIKSKSAGLLTRGTQREYSSKPLKHSAVERILVI